MTDLYEGLDFELMAECTLLAEAASPEDAITPLRKALAGTQVLLVQTRIAHWNVTGSDFTQLHELFKGQYEELQDSLDEIAERLRACGGVVAPTLGGLIADSPVADLRSTQADDTGEPSSAKDYVGWLLVGHQALSELWRLLGADCDAGTADLAGRRQAAHDKAAWMLRSTLGEQSKPSDTPTEQPAGADDNGSENEVV